jgi:acetyl-CoA carboxylase carboxyl transferase subunit alpha
MAHPEGYRKAMRVMRLAEKFGHPVVALINTPGAYPGIGAEERGQSQAIAQNLFEMSGLRTAIVCAVIGEGGSGGALGIGVGDRILIQEYAYYSVISPEGCAAILWKDGAKAPDAAAALKLTPRDLLALGLVDEVIPEPLGGAHRDPPAAAAALREALLRQLRELLALPPDVLLARRYEKLRAYGRGHLTGLDANGHGAPTGA